MYIIIVSLVICGSRDEKKLRADHLPFPAHVFSNEGGRSSHFRPVALNRIGIPFGKKFTKFVVSDHGRCEKREEARGCHVLRKYRYY